MVAPSPVLVIDGRGIGTLGSGRAFDEVIRGAMVVDLLGLEELDLHVLAAWTATGPSGDQVGAHLAAAGVVVGADEIASALDGLRSNGLTPNHGRPPTAAPPARGVVGGTEVGGESRFVAVVPNTFAPTTDGFAFFAPDGSVAELLTTPELLVLASFVTPASVAYAEERAAAGMVPLAPADVRQVVARLLGANLLAPEVDSTPKTSGPLDLTPDRRDALMRLVDAVAATARARRTAVMARGRPRPPVVPVVRRTGMIPPTALGMILAYAMEHDGGRLADLYDFEPRWVMRRRDVSRLVRERGPGVYLFSNYAWTMQENMAMSALVKELSPESVTVHGGPNTPSYEADVEAFLRAHPHVDLVARGEGERTVAEVLNAIDGRPAELAAARPRLAHVAGLSFRDGDRVVRTPDRERTADLDQFPSPYLGGLFEEYDGAAEVVVIETNRGCPYGCTFCDWGSATLSRLRKFSLERVFGELEWAATHQAQTIVLADSNFGMLARDVEITAKVAELKRQHGYPTKFYFSTAKNTLRHLTEIITILADAGIRTEAVLALQTTDPVVLDTINRSNIKTANYHSLAYEYRRVGLSLSTEYIVGLPGSTMTTVVTDLQSAVDREINVRANPVELLVNSPMNEPSYRAKFAIESEQLPGDRYRRLVVSSASHSREDLDDMWMLHRFFHFAENLGALRHVGRWLRQSTGVDELEIYRRMIGLDAERPGEFPLIGWAVRHFEVLGVPPLGWARWYDEVARFATDVMGVPDSSELRTVLGVQRAIVPDRGRSFPDRVELEHDYVAWFEAMLAAKEADPSTWPEATPPLASFGPGVLTIEDPFDACTKVYGRCAANLEKLSWELVSPVARDASVPA